MPKGKFGLPRPLTEYRLIINPHDDTAELVHVGPLGFARPFTKDNPPVDEDRIAECTISEAGLKFGAGSVSRGEYEDISKLTPERQEKALDRAEKWCRGTLEATAMEEIESGEATKALEFIRDNLGADSVRFISEPSGSVGD